MTAIEGPAIVVEVIATRGSAPRDAGTLMFVSATACNGTIGGGHLELQAITVSRAMLAAGDVQRHERRYALGPSLGQCCGGAVTLAFFSLDEATLAARPASRHLFHLQLHGAGHVGRAIATLLATIDCEVDWLDQRDDGFPEATTLGSQWPDHIHRIGAETIEHEVRHAPPGAFYLVLTHEHALDLRIVEAVLRRGDFAFLGLIGSKTKRASFAHRLEAKGVDAREIDRITCPIGIAGIAGKQPEIIAAAVVAQLLQLASARGSEAAQPAVDEQVDAGDVRGRV